MTLTVGSLFSGIGGFDLGLERTGGFRTVWFCEQDPYCQRVLARHWPGIPIHNDITELHDPEPVDVLCGGFPCQDLSSAGAKAGIVGARSGLWSEYARLVGELRPRYVLMENVADLAIRGLGTVLAGLAEVGYDAEYDCIPASAVGAPHRRDRIWIVGYPNGEGQPASPVDGQAPRMSQMGNPAGLGRNGTSAQGPGEHQGRERSQQAGGRGGAAGRSPWWDSEPDVGRVAHGVPARVDRLRALGNALVPQIAEWIGHRVLDHEDDAVSEQAA